MMMLLQMTTNDYKITAILMQQLLRTSSLSEYYCVSDTVISSHHRGYCHQIRTENLAVATRVEYQKAELSNFAISVEAIP